MLHTLVIIKSIFENMMAKETSLNGAASLRRKKKYFKCGFVRAGANEQWGK